MTMTERLYQADDADRWLRTELALGAYAAVYGRLGTATLAQDLITDLLHRIRMELGHEAAYNRLELAIRHYDTEHREVARAERGS